MAESAKDLLSKRKGAYRAVFDPASPAVIEVMEDLKRFCRVDTTTFHADARIHALLEGRREVALRISDHLNLPLDVQLKLYGGKDE
jgi:hypothetical protein